MTALAFGATAAVVVLAASLGVRLGGGRLGRALALALVSWLAGAGACTLAWQLRWFRPCGLLTPLLVGICILLLVGIVLPRAWRRGIRSPGSVGRLVGGALGAACGLHAAAAGWVLAGAANTARTTPQEAAVPRIAGEPTTTASIGDALDELLHAANRGFVRHLPLLGGLSDEVEAVRYVLGAPIAAQRRYVEQQRWQDLTDLQECRALLADAVFRGDLDALRTGDLLALYRVQQNPRFVAFFASERVQALLPDLRPSTMATGVRAAAAMLVAPGAMTRK